MFVFRRSTPLGEQLCLSVASSSLQIMSALGWSFSPICLALSLSLSARAKLCTPLFRRQASRLNTAARARVKRICKFGLTLDISGYSILQFSNASPPSPRSLLLDVSPRLGSTPFISTFLFLSHSSRRFPSQVMYASLISVEEHLSRSIINLNTTPLLPVTVMIWQLPSSFTLRG